MRKATWIFILASIVFLLTGCGQAPAAEAPDPIVSEDTGKLKGLCILVDAGHGGYDGGARVAGGGLWEKEFNLQMAMQIKTALEEQGARVIMTREEDKAFADRKRPDLNARLKMAKEGGADILLSIHMNQYHDSNESGPQVFYRKTSADSRLLAGCLQEALIGDLQPKKQRSALAGDYFILQLDVPSALVECGFISNAAEEKLLLSPDYQARLGESVANGVESYAALHQP